MKIAVVLVTYNRSKCLKVVLEALKNQNTKINSILIVDNCSNDDTQEMLKSINFISEFENEKLIKNISDECTNMYYKNSNNCSLECNHIIKLFSKIIFRSTFRKQPLCLALWKLLELR